MKIKWNNKVKRRCDIINIGIRSRRFPLGQAPAGWYLSPGDVWFDFVHETNESKYLKYSFKYYKEKQCT